MGEVRSEASRKIHCFKVASFFMVCKKHIEHSSKTNKTEQNKTKGMRKEQQIMGEVSFT
jgi:hypothetical protein